MNVLLINPGWVKRVGNIWKNIASCMPPLGIAYIAGYLEKMGVDVKILDLSAEQIGSREELEGVLKSMAFAPDYVGITATAPIINNAYDTAAICKSLYPSVKTVLGGVHPTIIPDEGLSHPDIDFVVRGEGEITMWEIVSGNAPESILGLSYKKNDQIMHNAERPYISDIDTLPYPAYHLLPMSKYHPAIGAYKKLPAISMITTRGCPGRCTFCFGDFLGTKVRRHSVNYIVGLIKMLKEKFGIREVSFYDDTFTVYKDTVKEVSQKLIDEKVDISWVCFSRIDFADEEMFRIMKKSGCHQIMFGIESGSQEILKNIKKRTLVENAKKVVAMTKKLGIDTRTSYMFGNPGETSETMEQTVKLALDINSDVVVFNITTPYPGTEMFNWADKNGYLRTKDWSKYDLSQPVMNLPTVTTELVQKYYDTSHQRYYGRPSFMFKRLLKMRTFNDFRNAAMAVSAIWSKK